MLSDFYSEIVNRIPFAVMMDLTGICEGSSGGAAEGALGDFDVWDDFVYQAENLNIFHFVLEGPGDILGAKDVLALCNEHQGSIFFILAGKSGITDQIVSDLKRIRNIVPLVGEFGLSDSSTDSESFGGTAARLDREKIPFGVMRIGQLAERADDLDILRVDRLGNVIPSKYTKWNKFSIKTSRLESILGLGFSKIGDKFNGRNHSIFFRERN